MSALISKLILHVKIIIVKLIRIVGRFVNKHPSLRRFIVAVLAKMPYISRRLRRIMANPQLDLNADYQLATWQLTPRASQLRERYLALKSPKDKT